MTRPSRFGTAVVTASLLAIGWATLRPVATQVSFPSACIICGPFAAVDFVLNVVLFLPFGAGLILLVRRWSWIVAGGLGTTLVVEALQWRLIAGRDASLSDIVANLAGTLLGAWLLRAWPAWVTSYDRSALRISIGLAAVGAVAAGGSALLLRSASAPETQWVQWALPRPDLDPISGRLRSASLNGIALSAGRIVPDLPGAFDSASSVEVMVTLDGQFAATRRRAMIIRTANQSGEGLFLGQWGHDIVFRTFSWASRARFRPLLAKADNALAGTSARSALAVTATSSTASLSISVDGGSGPTSFTLRRTVGLGWTLLMPWDAAVDSTWWPLNAAWLAFLVLPAAFFSARATRGTNRSNPAAFSRWWPVAMVVTTIAIAPLLAGISPTGALEWAGVAAGVLCGIALARLTRKPGTQP